ncbi:MAG: hypothetical protein QXT26_02545 [Thermoproteota archaeon]
MYKKVQVSNFRWKILEERFLEEGYNNITFNVNSHEVGLDLLVLKPLNIGYERYNANNVILSYSKVNPAKYIVHINASKDFFLVFGEDYDSRWQASNGDILFEHFEANSFINAYYVNQTGDFDITIEFASQKLYEGTLFVALMTIIFCVTLPIISLICSKLKVRLPIKA